MGGFFAYGQEAIDHLTVSDPQLGSFIQAWGKMERPVIDDFFVCLAYTIIGQQISIKAAQSVFGRFAALVGTLSAQGVARLDVEAIRSAGMGERKAIAILQAAREVLEGRISKEILEGLSDAQATQLLVSMKGVGTWTAQMVLIFCLQRPDVISYQDLGIIRGMKTVYGIDGVSREFFDARRAAYSPFGTLASLYLWAAANDTGEDAAML